MDRLFLVVMVFFATGLVGCSSSPEERKAEASAEISEEKAKMMKRYSECIEKFEGKKDVSEKCAPYKDAAETFLDTRKEVAPEVSKGAKPETSKEVAPEASKEAAPEVSKEPALTD